MKSQGLCSLFLIVALCFVGAHSQCAIRSDQDVSTNSPLLITNGAFVYPTRTNAVTLSYAARQQQTAFCPGTSVSVLGTNTRSNSITLTCSAGTKFNAPTNPSEFSNVRCGDVPGAVLVTRGACNNGNIIDIGFEVNTFVSLIDACFNSNRGTPTWAHAVITGAIAGRQTVGTPPDFRTANLFPNIAVATAYTRANQRSQLFIELGQNQATLDRFLPATGDHYFARGHLIARADMYYTAQQYATYYYVNVLPMWQSINAGNWLVVEDTVRALARNNGDIDVWVGGLYQLVTRKANGDSIGVFLTSNTDRGAEAIMVPRLLFKVAYHRASNRAIVYITVNDPYVSSTNPLPTGYQACKEYAACRQSDTRFNNVDRGFTYCCLWSDFIKDGFASALGLPNIGNPGALV